MAWLGKRRAVAYLRIVALLNVAMLILLVVTSGGGIDANGFLLGSDFISFWTAGRMLQQHANVYDGAAHIAAQREFFASAEGYTAFFYPPSFLPLCWPLGLLGYFPALATWLAATGLIYFLAVRRWWEDAAPQAPFWLLLLAFPPVPIVLTHGQTSFLVAGLLGLGAWLVPRRPVLAGLLFGLATIKPQLGPLVPLVLLLTGEWKAIASAAVTALAMAVLSTFMFGPDVWLEWLAASTRAQEAMETGVVPFGKMVSLFAALRLLGAPANLAYGVQVVVALGVALLLGRAAWKRRWSPGLAAAMLAGAPLATPFALDYDMVLLAFPLLWLAGEGLRCGFAPYEKLAIALAFAAPIFARPLAVNAGIPIMPAILALLFLVLLRRVGQTASKTPRAGSN